jgi:hypothetical protein
MHPALARVQNSHLKTLISKVEWWARQDSNL